MSADKMDEKPPGQKHDRLIMVAMVAAVFVPVAVISTLEKALLASTMVGAVWVAVTERWQNRTRPGFWVVVGFFALANVIAIWALPAIGPFKAGMAVSLPLGLAEGFLLYWLLGKLKPNVG